MHKPVGTDWMRLLRSAATTTNLLRSCTNLTWCRLIRMLVIWHAAFTAVLFSLLFLCALTQVALYVLQRPTLVDILLSNSDRCDFSLCTIMGMCTLVLHAKLSACETPVMFGSWLHWLGAPQFASPPLETPKSNRVNVFLETSFFAVAITLATPTCLPRFVYSSEIKRNNFRQA